MKLLRCLVVLLCFVTGVPKASGQFVEEVSVEEQMVFDGEDWLEDTRYTIGDLLAWLFKAEAGVPANAPNAVSYCVLDDLYPWLPPTFYPNIPTANTSAIVVQPGGYWTDYATWGSHSTGDVGETGQWIPDRTLYVDIDGSWEECAWTSVRYLAQ